MQEIRRLDSGSPDPHLRRQFRTIGQQQPVTIDPRHPRAGTQHNA
jgi:hypothetical protein